MPTSDPIEEMAFRLRERCHIVDMAAPCVVDLLYNAFAKIVPGLTVMERADGEMPDAEARANPATKTIEIRSSCLNDARRGVGHARWTVVHEFAHIVLNHSGVRHRKQNDKARRYDPVVAREETEANKLTASFLAPQHLAERCKTAEELQDYHQLSAVAAHNRFEEVQRQLRSRTGERRPLPPNAIDFLQAAKSRGVKIKSLDADQ